MRKPRWKLQSMPWTTLVHRILLHAFALLGLATVIVILIHQLEPQPPRLVGYDAKYEPEYTRPPCYCGESVSEAIDLGCTYDELSAGWLPSHCRDAELTAEFAALGDNPDGGWKYWADSNHTQPLTLEQVSYYADIQPENFHMSYEWHVQHCFFLWRKEHRMKATGRVYDPRSDTEHHILHCIMMLTTPSRGTSAGATLIG
jgi:hypothetical protein